MYKIIFSFLLLSTFLSLEYKTPNILNIKGAQDIDDLIKQKPELTEKQKKENFIIGEIIADRYSVPNLPFENTGIYPYESTVDVNSTILQHWQFIRNAPVYITVPVDEVPSEIEKLGYDNIQDNVIQKYGQPILYSVLKYLEGIPRVEVLLEFYNAEVDKTLYYLVAIYENPFYNSVEFTEVFNVSEMTYNQYLQHQQNLKQKFGGDLQYMTAAELANHLQILEAAVSGAEYFYHPKKSGYKIKKVVDGWYIQTVVFQWVLDWQYKNSDAGSQSYIYQEYKHYILSYVILFIRVFPGTFYVYQETTFIP